jgi:hypothetical protein
MEATKQKEQEKEAYLPQCARCGRFILAKIPKGITGVFYCGKQCHSLVQSDVIIRKLVDRIKEST